MQSVIIIIITTTCFSARLWNPPRCIHRKLNANQSTPLQQLFGNENMAWLLYLYTYGSTPFIPQLESLASQVLFILASTQNFHMLPGCATYLLLRAGLDSAWESGSALCAGCWYLQWLAPAHMDPRDRALEPSSWLSAELCSMN